MSTGSSGHGSQWVNQYCPMNGCGALVGIMKHGEGGASMAQGTEQEDWRAAVATDYMGGIPSSST